MRAANSTAQQAHAVEQFVEQRLRIGRRKRIFFVIVQTHLFSHPGARRLDSLVYLYRERIAPEGMVESYPAFTPEQVHGALAYYLANQKEIDEYLAQADALTEIQHQESRRDNAELSAKLRRMRPANQIPGLTPT